MTDGRRTIQVVYRDLAGLKPSERNARTHDAANLAAIKESLLRFGWTTPIAVAGDVILAGHGRAIAAREIFAAGGSIDGCLHGDVPTVDLSHLGETERRVYVLADNRTAEMAGWDAALVKFEVGEITGAGFDIAPVGFDNATRSAPRSCRGSATRTCAATGGPGRRRARRAASDGRGEGRRRREAGERKARAVDREGRQEEAPVDRDAQANRARRDRARPAGGGPPPMSTWNDAISTRPTYRELQAKHARFMRKIALGLRDADGRHRRMVMMIPGNFDDRRRPGPATAKGN